MISLVFIAGLTVPYLWLALHSGNRVFTWVTSAPLDQEVYAAWTRQAMDGLFFMKSLFSTEPDPGLNVNVAFYLCGRFCDWFSLSPQTGLQIFRVLSGLLFCPLLYVFLQMLGGDSRQRLLAYFAVLLGSGLGWLNPQYWGARPDVLAPIDMWQPEAVTFQTFYAISLHSVALLLMLGVLVCLLRAEQARRPYAYYLSAGILLAALGNCHSFDFIHIVVVWCGFQALRKWQGLPWHPGQLITLGLGSLSVLYQLYVLKHSLLFQWRSELPLPSPGLLYTLWGLGLPVLSALYWLRRPIVGMNRKGQSFLVCWAVLGVACAFTPLDFKRRLIMGAHIPWFTLYGYTLGSMARRPWALALAGMILLPGNWIVVQRDLRAALAVDPISPELASLTLGERLDPNQMQRVHQLVYEEEMLAWMQANLPARGTVLSLPTFSLYVPGRLGMRVYCGHWGETIHFEQKFQHTLEMLTLPMSDSDRLTRLREMQIDYLVTYSDPQQWQGRPLNDFRNQTPSCLKLLHHNPLMTLYAVVPQSAGTPPAGLERKEPPKTH